MNPKLCCSGLAVVVLLLTGCGTDTVKKDEQIDPVLVEYPVVYIERDINSSIDDENEKPTFFARDPAHFNAGAQLIYKNNAFADSPTHTLTEHLFDSNESNVTDQRIDIRDLSVSHDGQQFLVSIRAPALPDADVNEQPTWNIWRYTLSSKTLERIIVNDNTAEQGEDLMASFLPDGRIIFASTRQRTSRAILLDEGKPQYTAHNERDDNSVFNLHIMNGDGTNIKQLTFNLSHDIYPLVMQDGRIIYSRWDAMGGEHGLNLYSMNPDGTNNHLVYGWHSHQLSLDGNNEQIDFVKPQQMPNGDLLMLLSSSDGSRYQKKPITININDFSDNEQLIQNATTVGNAQQDLFPSTTFSFDFLDTISPSGYLTSLYPLPDHSERFLLSWDLCRVIVNNQIKACAQLSEDELSQEGVVVADPAYELWIYNGKDNTQQLVSKTSEGKMITQAIVMQESVLPHDYISDKTYTTGLDIELANQQSAAINIRSVYDIDGIDSSGDINRLKDPSITPAANLPARFLRIVRGVPMPPDDVRDVKNTDFGRSRNQLMREILGYTPIQPDGSVYVKVPANVPMALSVLDSNGQRIGGRHKQWITLKAGETLTCNGCHEANSTKPHGRLDAQADSINAGAVGGEVFPHTNDTIIPTSGQSMAEADAMVNGLPQLTADILYRDIWTDEQLSTLNPTIEYLYGSLETSLPLGSDCFTNWTSYCRLQINYIDHIQPLWELSRQVFDDNSGELIADNTCTSCHSLVDADNLTQVPAGQLDLSATPSVDQPAHLTSYRELFFNDVEQEIVEGILVDRRVPLLDDNGNIVYQLDGNGDLLLDAQGNAIPVLTTVPIKSILSTGGSKSSGDFFKLFLGGTHEGRLSMHELKLLSEWLDIGGQYYNTPFYLEE